MGLWSNVSEVFIARDEGIKKFKGLAWAEIPAAKGHAGSYAYEEKRKAGCGQMLATNKSGAPRAPFLLLQCEVQASLFLRRRSAARPANPTPNSDRVRGSGIATRKPRISPPGTLVVWMFR